MQYIILITLFTLGNLTMNLSKQRKLILLFKTFTQKVMLPHIKSDEAPLNQWNKFISMLSLEPINLSEMQIYVDTLPSNNLLRVTNNTILDRNINGKKKQEKDDSDLVGFNPNKTFGGERPRFANLHSTEDSVQFRRQSHRDESMRIKTQPNSNHVYTTQVMDGLKKLIKNMQQNQALIDKPAQQYHHTYSMTHSSKPNNIQHNSINPNQIHSNPSSYYKSYY